MIVYENARIGSGKIVHIVIGGNPLCGSGSRTGTHNFHRPLVHPTADAVTCKKCQYKLGNKQG